MMQQLAKAQADSSPPSADEPPRGEVTDADVEVGGEACEADEIGGIGEAGEADEADEADEDIADLLLVEALLVLTNAVKEHAAALRILTNAFGPIDGGPHVPILGGADPQRDTDDASPDVTAVHTDDDDDSSFAFIDGGASIENFSTAGDTVSETTPSDSAQGDTPSVPAIDFASVPTALRPHLLSLSQLVEHLPGTASLGDLAAAFERQFGNPGHDDESAADD